MTNCAKLVAVTIGSYPKVVGNSVAPNADTRSFYPAAWNLEIMDCCISKVVVPNTLLVPK